MLSMKCFQAAAVSLAAIGLGFAGPDASAGSCGKQRSYHSGHYSHHGGSHASASYRSGSYRVSVSVGSGRHYDRGYCDRGYSSHRVYHRDRGYHHGPSHHTTHVVREVRQQPSGYWKRVYHPPVYRTYYRQCGTPYRVCVRAGFYEKVWVSTGYCR